MRVTWFWPGNSLEWNWQLRPYIYASAWVRPAGRGPDELRTPDLRSMRGTSGRGPLPGVSRREAGGAPSFAGRPAAAHRGPPGADGAPVARHTAAQVKGQPGDTAG